jgi:hypothetical protein
MTPQEIEALFTRSDDSYAFARWGRPLAPVVFVVDDATLTVVKSAIEAVCQLAGHSMSETDPELGSNLMMFFFKDWAELLEVPDLDRLVPDLGPLVEKLDAAGANQYRLCPRKPWHWGRSCSLSCCGLILRSARCRHLLCTRGRRS